MSDNGETVFPITLCHTARAVVKLEYLNESVDVLGCVRLRATSALLCSRIMS